MIVEGNRDSGKEKMRLNIRYLPDSKLWNVVESSDIRCLASGSLYKSLMYNNEPPKNEGHWDHCISFQAEPVHLVLVSIHHWDQ